MAVTLAGNLATITGNPIEDIAQVTVKSPAPVAGSKVITTQPVRVPFDRATGKFTITVEETTGWLYIDGDGWSDTIRFVAAAGMKTVQEAIWNAMNLPGDVANYLDVLADAEARIAEMVQQAAQDAAQWYHEALTASSDLGVLPVGVHPVPSTAVAKALKLPAGQAGHVVQYGTDYGTTQLYYTQSGEQQVHIRWKSFGGWGPWRRIDAHEAPVQTVSSGDVDALGAGWFIVPDASAVKNAPPVSGPVVLHRTGEVDWAYTQGDALEEWVRRVVPGAPKRWEQVRAQRIVPVSLTRPLAGLTEQVSSRSVRIPFRVPVRTTRLRVVIRNANYRTNTTYPGLIKLRTLCIGTGGRDTTTGELTPNFVKSSEFPGGLQIVVRDVDFEGADGYTSAWMMRTLNPGVDYMLSYGYQHNGIKTHLGMGGGWWTNYKATNAELREDSTAAKQQRLPLDVRIEAVTEEGAVHEVLIGDSISAASNADFPVLEAPAHVAARIDHHVARLHGFGGAAMGEWIGANWGAADTLKWQDLTKYGRADRAVIALGNNDIHAGTDMSTLQANLQALVALVRERIAPEVVVCTVTPRTAWTGTSKDTLRRSFNDWLRSHPMGVLVAETARAVEDESGTAPRADYVVGDGIHFNTAGTTALVQAIKSVAVQTGPVDTGGNLAGDQAAQRAETAASLAEASAGEAQGAVAEVNQAKVSVLAGAVAESAAPPEHLQVGDLFIDATTGTIYRI